MDVIVIQTVFVLMCGEFYKIKYQTLDLIILQTLSPYGVVVDGVVVDGVVVDGVVILVKREIVKINKDKMIEIRICA